MKPQLLDLFDSKPTFENFISVNNNAAINNLKNFTNRFTHIVGNIHNGKTHLLKAWLSLANQKNHTTIYLNIAANPDSLLNVNALVTNHQFFAIDNIDKANDQQQIAIFDLFNRIKLENKNSYLLTSSSEILEKLDLRDDLKTRLLSGMILKLKTLNDQQILEVLHLFALNEGIGITDNELNYLINHYTRNIGDLIRLLRKAAEIALIKKHSLTILILKEAMALYS